MPKLRWPWSRKRAATVAAGRGFESSDRFVAVLFAGTSVLAALGSGFALLAHAGQSEAPEPIAPAPLEKKQPLAGEARASSAKGPVLAQARPAQQPAEQAPTRPAPQAPAPQAPAPPPPASDAWQKMPKMIMEAVYAGPLRDTIIQRWRDPVDGAVCHVYLPIVAPTSPVQPNGFVHYGPNGIGSLSCHAAPAAAPRAAERRQPAPAPAGHAQKPTAPAAGQ